jgi:voltage-gated potassium channel Kch
MYSHLIIVGSGGHGQSVADLASSQVILRKYLLLMINSLTIIKH